MVALASSVKDTVGVEVPETLYAHSGDVSVAYQVVGDGPFDLVYVPGSVSNVELIWDDEVRAAYFGRLASFARLIVFDKRGTGASDHVQVGDLETRMDDVRAVMDAAGSSRAALMGVSEGGPMSVLFAATYPERVGALILYGSLPRFAWAPDFPWGQPLEEWQRELDEDVRRWGTVELAREFDPSANEQELEALARRLRLSASPATYRGIGTMGMAIDVRDVLPSIAAPTLVLHRTEDHVPIDGARWAAAQIPRVEFVELPGGPHLPFVGDWRAVVDEVERFVVGLWERGEWEEAPPERVLATVLFTDIVGSTKKMAELGDRRWRDLLERHHGLIRSQLARYRGVEMDTAGDGFFARFDGPARAIGCAVAITDTVRELGIEVRAGLHTGECEIADGKIAGIAVSTGARITAEASPGEVLVSSTVKDLVAGSGIRFDDRGTRQLKGIAEPWHLFTIAR
jgi:class 3 adenylate cyclase/pimeloyl-ACP methyl ester carboxylesterase